MRNTAGMAYDQELAERVREHVEQEKGLTEKRMFGGLAFLINGKTAVSASSNGGLLLRVDPTETETLLQQPRARPFEMRGRETNGWLYIDVDASVPDDELARWIRIGVTYARSLPPK